MQGGETGKLEFGTGVAAGTTTPVSFFSKRVRDTLLFKVSMVLHLITRNLNANRGTYLEYYELIPFADDAS